MPYKALRGIDPPDDFQVIWRYFDFAKFASTLLTRALFFARLDLLGDPSEGSVSVPSVGAREAYWRRMRQDHELPESVVEDLIIRSPHFTKQTRSMMYVNCWCMSECESPALRKLYGEGDRAVAIQSTYARLRALGRGALSYRHRIHLRRVRDKAASFEWRLRRLGRTSAPCRSPRSVPSIA